MADIPGNSLATRIQVATQLPMQQKLALMMLAAITAALIAGGWMWSRTPDFRVLFANVPDRDGGAIIASLQQMNVPYKIEGGALSVPASRVHELRLKLAAQGLPKGTLAGFELMENQKFGASQFLEQVNYQRALEGELARSIQSLTAVQGARVHLALAKPTPFLRDAAKSTASVLLNLQPGHALDPAQVAAITHLVSNSVADLPAKNVSVVDQHGALLSNNTQSRGVLDSSQIRFRQEVESGYVTRIEAILAPLVGSRNVRAQVTAELDFSETEQAEETHKPNQKPDDAVVRSQQSSESSTAGNETAGASGVPGALSNQPSAPGAAPADGKDSKDGKGTASKSGSATSRKESVVNYEVDRNIRHTRQSAGRLKRLSVAVVVNHRSVADKKGKSTQKPLSEAEIGQFTELVKGVMGFDKERGDVLSVVNGAFTPPDKILTPDTPFWKQPGFIDTALESGKNLMIAALVLYLVLGVLRPMMRRMSEPPAPPPAALAAEANGGGEPGAPNAALPAPEVDPYEQSLQSAKQLAKQDPRVVANVVKEWVGGNA